MDLLGIISADTRLRFVARTNGGEYAGSCPWCGGDDRFRVWPNHPRSESGRYWCRQCNRSGDGITYLREYHSMSFQEACGVLRLQSKLQVYSRNASREYR